MLGLCKLVFTHIYLLLLSGFCSRKRIVVPAIKQLQQPVPRFVFRWGQGLEVGMPADVVQNIFITLSINLL